MKEKKKRKNYTRAHIISKVINKKKAIYIYITYKIYNIMYKMNMFKAPLLCILQEKNSDN